MKHLDVSERAVTRPSNVIMFPITPPERGTMPRTDEFVMSVELDVVEAMQAAALQQGWAKNDARILDMERHARGLRFALGLIAYTDNVVAFTTAKLAIGGHAATLGKL
jgi:hypothetical protein